MKISPVAVGAAIGVAIGAISQAASRAAPPPPAAVGVVDGERKGKARELLRAGLELYRDAEFAAALERFEAAYELYPTPSLLLNIGTTLRYLGRNAEASRRYERYVADPGAEPRHIEELRRIGREIELVTGTVVVTVEDRAARTSVNGQPLPPGHRQRWRVDPGRHTVVVERSGQGSAVKLVEVAAGQEVTVALRPPGSASEKPRIVVVREEASSQPFVGLAVGGLGVVGIGLGTVFGVLALESASDARAHCRTSAEPWICDAAGEAYASEADTQATVSTIGLGVGAAALAAGLVVWWTAPDAPVTTEIASGWPAGGAVARVRARW